MKLVNQTFIEVDGKRYPVVKTVNLIQKGWELDYEAYVIDYGEYSKDRYGLIWSDHGELYFVEHLTDIELLEGFISDYKNYITQIKDVIKMLK